MRAEARAASVERGASGRLDLKGPSGPKLSLNITTISFRPPLGYFLSLCLAFNPAEGSYCDLISKASHSSQPRKLAKREK